MVVISGVWNTKFTYTRCEAKTRYC